MLHELATLSKLNCLCVNMEGDNPLQNWTVHMKSFLQLKTCSINQQKVMWERKPYLDPLKKALQTDFLGSESQKSIWKTKLIHKYFYFHLEEVTSTCKRFSLKNEHIIHISMSTIVMCKNSLNHLHCNIVAKPLVLDPSTCAIVVLACHPRNINRKLDPKVPLKDQKIAPTCQHHLSWICTLFSRFSNKEIA
jgi:hypothetical protein